MKRHIIKVFAVMAAVMFMSITVLELSADARAGGGRSSGSRGSRSYSSPASPFPPAEPATAAGCACAKPHSAAGRRRVHEEHGRRDHGRYAGKHAVQQRCRSR